jgi:hypothetical protein
MIAISYALVPVVVLVALLALLAVFQIALAAGAPFGRFAWGGKSSVLPSRQRLGSVVSVVIYAVIAVVALDRAGLIDILPDLLSRIAMWVVVGFFALSIIPNLMSSSRAERSVMVPVTALLAVLSLLVALG